MVEVNVKKAIRELNRAHRELSETERNRATARAINRSATTARAKTAKAVRGVYRIKSTNVKKTIKKRQARPSDLMGGIVSTGQALPIQAFNPTKTKKGIRATIKGVRKTFPGAFAATMKSGHKGIFARAKYEGNRLVTRRKRVAKFPKADLPIVEIQTLSVPSAMANDAIVQNLRAIMTQKFVENFARELKFRSMRAAAKP